MKKIFPFLLLLLIFIFSCARNQVPDNHTLSGKIAGIFTGCGTGAFVNGLSNLSDFQNMIGKDLAVVLFYVHWQDPFPTTDCETVYNNDSIPLITWEPWITHQLGTLEAISSGSYESYVTEFMTKAKEWARHCFCVLPMR